MSTNLEFAVLRLPERLAGTTTVNEELSGLMRVPTAVLWNRLEGRPRSDDLTRALRAEVRDPLWLLARQWQFGEFAGEDAGMPVRAKLAADMTALTSVTLRDSPPAPYDASVPLEAVVEHRPFEPDFMAGLYIGKRWLAELSAAFGADAPALTVSFTGAYAIGAPVAGARDLDTLHLTTHRGELALRMALAGRAIDGTRLFGDMAGALAAAASPSEAFVARGVVIGLEQLRTIDALAADLVAALGLAMPGRAPGEAWVSQRLEHSFTLGAAAANGTETRLVADRYPGGRLDWCSVDIDSPGVAALGEPRVERRVASFVPTPIRLTGAPNVRWWEFEDRHVGFGLTTAAKTDVVKLLLAQFALVYSNDWFIVPFAAEVGTLIDTQGIVVTDNFGISTLIEPTGKRGAELGLAGQWGMWTLARRDAPGTVDTRFFLAPALARSQESKPLDEVVFLRDEMTNLVWGVESVFPDSLGGGRDARSAGKLLREVIAKDYLEEEVPAAAQAEDVLLAYRLMGQVPENWIPFVSVRLQEQPTATAFLQGAMPRVPPLAPLPAAGEAVVLAHNVVLPRGTLLARDPVANPNLINEEEVLRGGAVIRRTVQQARTSDGTTVTWSGRQRLCGRGEGSSGLTFDQVALKAPIEP